MSPVPVERAPLNLRNVQAFVAVVDSGGFRGAAKRLKLSQSSVTQQIKKLEAGLGLRLLVRARAEGCTPTLAGNRFLPQARALLRAESRALEAATGRGMMVGASSNVGLYLLLPLLKRYSDSLPMAAPTPSLVIGSNPETADRLEGGEIDLAVMEWWDGREGFVSLPWRQEDMVLIVPRGHPWERLKAVPVAKLFSEPWIAGESGTGTGRLMRQTFGPRVDRLQMAMTLGSTEAVKAAVRAGFGVSLVTRSSVDQDLRMGTLKAVAIQGLSGLRKDLVLVLPKESPSTSLARAFAQSMVQAAT